jgi:hypothetical protein
MGSVGWLAGMPVCEALAYVEQHRAVFDVVHVKYNDEVQKGSLFFLFSWSLILALSATLIFFHATLDIPF